MNYSAHYASPLGLMVLASDGEKLVGLWNEEQKYFAASVKGGMAEEPELPVFTAVKTWLDAYFSGLRPDLHALPLAPEGSAFRKAVWELLCAIPYGKCTTYGKIAQSVARRMRRKNMSSQAVGGAVGRNPISIIVPCHRVIGSNGNLTGYAGGMDKKVRLLELEGIATFTRANGELYCRADLV
ncbi:MAG: methylated-DNA--[protein]-cysteine S-methyltransferase [Deltaproteobacteria bacterium]|nr:methylated-DNA--[protein]-cysteine S-methyltransferase [Deltaproteobacteria bacterium]